MAMINRGIILIVFFVLSLSTSLWAGEINSVVSEGNKLRIQLSDKSDYKIIPTDDPFKLKIEILNAKPGILSKKILYHEGLISEISAQPNQRGSIVEILLAEPSSWEIKTEANVLVVAFNQETRKSNESIISKIIELTMEKTEDGFEISIQGDSELPEPKITKADDYVNLEFYGVIFDTEPSKDIPLSVKREGEALILSFALGKNTEVETLYLGDEIILDIKKSKVAEDLKVAKIQKEDFKKTAKKEKIEISAPVINPSGEKTISLDLQDADIVGALRLLADTAGYNLVLHPRVGGKITLNLRNVPLMQAIDLICKNSNLVKLEEENNVIRVLPIESYMIELVLEKKETRVYKLKYVRPSNILQRTADLRTALADSKIFQFFGVETIQVEKDPKTGMIEYKVTSIPEKKETEKTIKYQTATETREETTTKVIGIAVDELTGSLIINAPLSIHKEIEKVIAKLDVPQKQILIEARIIEISSSFSKSLGFEWGISWISPDSRTTIGGSQSGSNVLGGSTPVAVNLPARTGRVAQGTSAITVGYLNVSGTFALDLRISALQQTGKGKVISNPKIVTVDNQKAVIVQGETIPYGELTTSGGQTNVTTKFKDVAIQLDVTPRLTEDEKINLYVNFIKEDLVEFIDIGNTEGGVRISAPRTIKLSSSTEATILDGETLVLGGIYKKIDRMSNSKVPGLGDIPIVGELFTSRGRDEDIYEVLIFITPRILRNQ